MLQPEIQYMVDIDAKFKVINEIVLPITQAYKGPVVDSQKRVAPERASSSDDRATEAQKEKEREIDSISEEAQKEGKQTHYVIDFKMPPEVEIEAQFERLEKTHHFFTKVDMQPEYKSTDAFLEVFAAELEPVFAQCKEEVLKQVQGWAKDQIRGLALRQFVENRSRSAREWQKIYDKLGEHSQSLQQKLIELKATQDQLAIRERSKELYKKLFWLCKVVADQVEDTAHGSDSLAYEQAYKLLVVFGQEDADFAKTIKNFTNYIRLHNAKVERIIHDTFASVMLPVNGECVTLEQWQKWIKEKGREALHLFGLADKIEKRVAGDVVLTDTHKVPESFRRAQEIQSELSYERGRENPKLASLCLENGLTEKDFEKCLDLNKEVKRHDNLPDIEIAGKALGEEYENFWLVKLPIGDPRGYMLGKITNCCQSIGGDSERCVIDGMTRENNGFYVLLKRTKSTTEGPVKTGVDGKKELDYEHYRIVGQGYAWISQENNLVFDSWENLSSVKQEEETQESKEIKPVTRALLEAFAKRVTAVQGGSSTLPVISRVMVGLGGGTPRYYRQQEVAKVVEVMKEGYQYGDAKTQAVIYELELLSEQRKRIDERFGTELRIGEMIVSLGQAELLLHLSEQEAAELKAESPINIKLLISSRAVEAYKKKYVTFTQLKKYIDEQKDAQVAALLSEDARKAYAEKVVTFDQLKDFDAKKIEVLVSEDAKKACVEKFVTFDQLKDFDAEKIEAMASEEALAAYATGAKFEDLYNLWEKDRKKFEALLSWQAKKAYENGYVRFDQLKDLDVEKIAVLVSSLRMKAYYVPLGQLQGFDVGQLKGFDVNKIKALVSLAAWRSYADRIVTFGQLKGFDAEKIEALVSENARKVYAEKLVTFDQLKDLDAEKIRVLVSENVRKAYAEKFVTFGQLKDFTAEKIKKLVAGISRSVYEAGGRVEELSNLWDKDRAKYVVLVSWDANQAYAEKFVTFDQLKVCDVNKIEALVSRSAQKAYAKGSVTFNQLKDCDIGKIAALVSEDAIKACAEGHVSVDQLKDCDVKKIAALVSEAAQYLYKHDVNFAQLKSCDGEKLGVLITREALDTLTFCISKGIVASTAMSWTSSSMRTDLWQINYAELLGYDRAKIKALLSRGALAAYKQGVAYKDLKKFNSIDIELFTAPEAIEAYKAGVSLQDYRAEMVRGAIEKWKRFS